MTNINVVSLSGNLCADPEIRATQSGVAVARLRVASNRSFKRGETWEEETVFVEVTAWAKLAEDMRYYGKGQAVFVQGRLHLDQWTGKDGKQASKLTVVADQLLVIQPKSPPLPAAPAATDEQSDEDELPWGQQARKPALPF